MRIRLRLCVRASNNGVSVKRLPTKKPTEVGFFVGRMDPITTGPSLLFLL